MNFYEIPEFKQGTLSMQDKCATSTLFLSQSGAAKKLIFINGAYKIITLLSTDYRVEQQWSGAEEWNIITF